MLSSQFDSCRIGKDRQRKRRLRASPNAFSYTAMNPSVSALPASKGPFSLERPPVFSNATAFSTGIRSRLSCTVKPLLSFARSTGSKEFSQVSYKAASLIPEDKGRFQRGRRADPELETVRALSSVEWLQDHFGSMRGAMTAVCAELPCRT
jgi:hypothetical protein